MPNSLPVTIEKAEISDDVHLRTIGLVCYDTNIDPNHRCWIVRWMFRRYFSRRKFAARRKNGVLIYCLKAGGEICGFYELEKDGLLSSLYVLPSCQHRGYGKALLEDARRKAKENQIKEMRLDARDFYVRQGFEKNGQSRIVLGITMIPFKIKIS